MILGCGLSSAADDPRLEVRLDQHRIILCSEGSAQDLVVLEEIRVIDLGALEPGGLIKDGRRLAGDARLHFWNHFRRVRRLHCHGAARCAQQHRRRRFGAGAWPEYRTQHTARGRAPERGEQGSAQHLKAKTIVTALFCFVSRTIGCGPGGDRGAGRCVAARGGEEEEERPGG
jgi:hypothetical protein